MVYMDVICVFVDRYIDSLVQDCIIPSALAMELLQFYTGLSIYIYININ